MNANESAPVGEPLTSLLVAGDRALAAGQTPAEAAAAAPPEWRTELERGLGCAQLLRRVLPRRGSSEETEAVAALPLTQLGRFEIRRELGRGSFGIVFLAHDPRLGRDVALKVPRPGALVTPELRERFLREAHAAASLDHPNVVPVYESGEVGPICFIASAYCPGVTLAAWLRQRTEPVPVRLAARLASRLAAVVDYAHRRGVIHRDLKPSNVLLQRRSESGDPIAEAEAPDATTVEAGGTGAEGDLIPKVTDFGLAKLAWEGSAAPDAGGEATQSGVILGTPAYMAPEQASGRSKAVGPAADVYAVGVILYEMLAGRPPFRGETVLETLEQVRFHEPVPPRRWQPRLPRDLETICLKCLHKELNRRYASAAALADDLRRFLEGLPIHARPIRGWERGLKWVRRRPTAAALAGVTTLALLGGVAGALGHAHRELWHAQREREQERERADQERALRYAAADSSEQARTVLAFFLDHVLAAARPEGQDGGLGREATIRAAVAAAEPKVAEAFRRRPLVEASVRNSLGVTYWYLGDNKAAIEQHERALALRGSQLGSDHPDTLTSMSNLALAYHAGGQFDKAVALLEQLLAKRQERYGADHRVTLATMNNLAGAYQAAGRLDKALSLCQQVFAKRQEKLAPDHPDVLTSMGALAAAYGAAGQFDKAAVLFEQLLAKFRAKLGTGHPDTLATMHNLAAAYEAAGQVDKAVPLCEETWAGQKEKLGPDHPRTLNSMNNLALTYQAAGRFDRAVPLLEELLTRSAEKLGADHPDTLTAMNNLGAAYQGAGRFDRALPLCEQALARKQEKLGADHPDTLASMSNLARAYAAVGQLDKALLLFEQTLAKCKKRLGPNHPLTLSAMSDLAIAYLDARLPDKALSLRDDFLAAQRRRLGPDRLTLTELLSSFAQPLMTRGHYAEAETVLRECLTICQSKLPDDWLTFDTQSQLGACLLGQKHYADAEPLLVGGYQGMLSRAKSMPAAAKIRLTEARERLVRLYEAWGKPEDAARWRAAPPEAGKRKR